MCEEKEKSFVIKLWSQCSVVEFEELSKASKAWTQINERHLFVFESFWVKTIHSIAQVCLTVSFEGIAKVTITQSTFWLENFHLENKNTCIFIKV